MSGAGQHIVLALDIAKHRTGWAVNSPSWPRPFWGTYDLAGEWDRHEGKRLSQWRRFLLSKIEQHGVTYMAVEAFFIDLKSFNYNGTVPMAQMHGIAMQVADEKGIGCGAAQTRAWRKHFLGADSAPKFINGGRERTDWLKDKALKVCASRGWLCSVHDEAEALAIADYTMAVLDPNYAHRIGPVVRRQEFKADMTAFRGEEVT